VPFSSKITTYFVVSVVIYIGLAGASYFAGQALRRWLGG
jgi:CHASE3 domain sensor protein